MPKKQSSFDKPFIDTPGLLDLLISRGISINDRELAESILKEYGYYGMVNGFKRAFLSDKSTHNSEIYRQGTSLLDIARQYIIDSQIQQLFLTILFPIENHFKTVIGYEVAKKFGVNNFGTDDVNNPDPETLSYLDVNNYRGQNRNYVVQHIHKHVLTSNDDPVRYYRAHHNHIPPWIMMSNMNLGTSIKYYQILPEEMRIKIGLGLIPEKPVASFHSQTGTIAAALDVLRQFRNSAAHSSPMCLTKAHFKKNALEKPSKKILEQFIGEKVFNGLNDDNGINDLFAAFIFSLLLTDQPISRKNVIRMLKGFEDQNTNNGPAQQTYRLYLQQAGLPVDYISRLESVSDALQ